MWTYSNYVRRISCVLLLGLALSVCIKQAIADDADLEQRLIAIINRATVASHVGRYDEAEALYKQAVELSQNAPGNNDILKIESLRGLAYFYFLHGRYTDAEPLYEQVLTGRRRASGPNDLSTLRALNDLARTYYFEGRYRDAEPLFAEALQGRRQVLGLRHPDTLLTVNDLARVYQAEGRYDEAEMLYKEALDGRRAVLPSDNPDILISESDLASLYMDMGKYDNAEKLCKDALEKYRKILGPNHPHTLRVQNNLAVIYSNMGRYAQSERTESNNMLGQNAQDRLLALYNQAINYSRQGRLNEASNILQIVVEERTNTLGKTHPDTLLAMGQLASVYQEMERYDDAIVLYEQTLDGQRAVLGEGNPQTLNTLSNLSTLYITQHKHTDAENVLLKILKTLPKNGAPTNYLKYATLNNLAFLYAKEGRPHDAEQIYRRILSDSTVTVDPYHPDILDIKESFALLLAKQRKIREAVHLLEDVELNRLVWIGLEFFEKTELGEANPVHMKDESSLRNFIFTLATKNDSSIEARRLGANVMIRWKYIRGEDEAFLTRLSRRAPDRATRDLINEISALRTQVADQIQAGRNNEAENTRKQLDEKELYLAQSNGEYKEHLTVRTAGVDDLQSKLAADAGLIEFRRYSPGDLDSAIVGEPHWAAMLLLPGADPLVKDIGTVAQSEQLRKVMFDADAETSAGGDQAAQTLFAMLFGIFDSHIASLKTIYVVPDGNLGLIPFGRLKLTDGRYWLERQDIRILQTSRDLLQPPSNYAARGLVALGGIDFDASTDQVAAAGENSVVASVDKRSLEAARQHARQSMGGHLNFLQGSSNEVEKVGRWFETTHEEEPRKIWRGADATESNLKDIGTPPRILHLATHGLYLTDDGRPPMLLSGIALAGANRALADQQNDGILFSLEAATLNLQGTEFVALSACKTAEGKVDYSEGIYGLARAFRIAGAKSVLLTLWNIGDISGVDFMEKFYEKWLGKRNMDPASALMETQRDYIKTSDDNISDPLRWAPYEVIE